jgi:hypothetical protein
MAGFGAALTAAAPMPARVSRGGTWGAGGATRGRGRVNGRAGPGASACDLELDLQLGVTTVTPPRRQAALAYYSCSDVHMTSPTYRTCRLRAVRTSGHRCEAVRGGGTVPDARGMVGRGGTGAGRGFHPDPVRSDGGWSENRIPQTRSCWLTAGWTCACPSLPVEPLVKAHASGLAARGLCRPHSSSPGWAGRLPQVRPRAKRPKKTCAKKMLVAMYIRASLHSSVFIPLNCHNALRAHAA